VVVRSLSESCCGIDHQRCGIVESAIMMKPLMHFTWLVLVLSVFSSSARAGQLGDLKYEIADGQVAITDCKTLAKGELVIPN